MGFDSTSDDQRNPKEIFFQFFFQIDHLDWTSWGFSSRGVGSCSRPSDTFQTMPTTISGDDFQIFPDVWIESECRKAAAFVSTRTKVEELKKILNFKAMMNRVCVLGRSKIIQAELQRSFLQQSFCFRFYKLNKKNHSGPSNLFSRKLIWVDRSMPKQ